jgi:hypothetical protein
VAGTSKHGNESSCFIKGGEFLNLLSGYGLLKNNFALRSQ